MRKLKRSKSQIIDNNMILNSLNEFSTKQPESIKPIKSLNGNATYYPKRPPSFELSKLGYKPYIDYDQNLTFENTIDQIFEGLDQADIDEIKSHTKWNQNVSNVGLPKEKCLKNLQILAAIIKKKKANSPESTKAIQEGVMSNVQDFLHDSGCYGNLNARLESYRITNLESLVMSNALYQYIRASGGLLTHFHDHPASYAKYPFKKSPINHGENNNINASEMDHRDIQNHDVKYHDEYIEFLHNSMKSIASGINPEAMKDFILKNLATKLGYQDIQYKSPEPADSHITDLVQQYDQDLAKYNKSFNEVFEPKISDDSENDTDILELIKEAIGVFEDKNKRFLHTQRPNQNIMLNKNIKLKPLIEDFLSKEYLSGLVNDKPALNDDAKNQLTAKIQKLNLQTIILQYSQYKISKTTSQTKPDIALICKKNSKKDLQNKAEKYIKYRDEFPEKQRKKKEEVLKNLAENGYLDDISNDEDKKNELTNYIPSQKLLNCVLNHNKSSKDDINDYVDALIPTLHLFDKKSRDQQEENNTLLNDVNFQPEERRIGDKEFDIICLTLYLLCSALVIACGVGVIVLPFSPLVASISFGLGAIGLATTVFVGVKTFLKNRSNNRFNVLSPVINDKLKNEIKEKLNNYVKSVKNVEDVVKNEEVWNEFIKPSTELQNELDKMKKTYNININDLYYNNLKSIRQSLIDRFVIHDMVKHRIGHPIQPNNKVRLDNLSPSVNDVNEDSNLDFTGKDDLVPKYETTLSHNIFEESDSHDDDSIYSKDINKSKDIILPDIVVEDFDATKNPSSQRTIQSAKSSLRKNEPNFTNLNDAEKLAEIKNRLGNNLYKRLANDHPQVKVQNYINNEDLPSLVDQEFGRKNTQVGMPRRSNTAQMSERIISGKLSEKHRFLITMYGDQKTPLLAQYRDLMPIPKKTELASDNPRSKGMIKT